MEKTNINVPIIPPNLSREERKELLEESANKYLEAIESQIGDLKDVGKNTLVISGIIVAAYALTEFLLPQHQSSNKALPIVEKEGKGNSIFWTTLKGAATSILLAIAKQKLLVLMDNLRTKNAESNS
jgi:hypothetical protein